MLDKFQLLCYWSIAGNKI